MIIGTPDDAVDAVKLIQQRSGGVGGILGLAHEWASTEKTLRSYELWMRYVAPRFQGQIEVLENNRDWIETRIRQVGSGTTTAQVKAFTDAGKDLPEHLKQAMGSLNRARE